MYVLALFAVFVVVRYGSEQISIGRVMFALENIRDIRY